MPSADAVRTAVIELTVMGTRVKAEIPVPEGNVRPAALLPVFQSFADTVVDIAVQKAVGSGQTLSCRKGCGACCRQLAPISGAEIQRLREVVGAMPTERRDEIRSRFATIEQRLEEAGIAGQLGDIGALDADEARRLGRGYFALGLACPFLEDESCSVHAERPVACREYVVSSPPEHCAAPSAETVVKIPVPPVVFRAVSSIGVEQDERPRITALGLLFAGSGSEPAPVNAAAALEAGFRAIGRR